MCFNLCIVRGCVVFSQFRVRRACTSDTESVTELVKTLDMNEHLLADMAQYNRARRDADGTHIQCFVAECNEQVVGVAITRQEEVSVPPTSSLMHV